MPHPAFDVALPAFSIFSPAAIMRSAKFGFSVSLMVPPSVPWKLVLHIDDCMLSYPLQTGDAKRGEDIGTDNQTERNDISAREAARKLGVDKSTVVRWLQKNEMAGWRTPLGNWRIPATEINRLLGSKENPRR